MKTYKGKIDNLEPNQIFCFGSNPVGINGSPRTGKGGSALFALNKRWVSQGENMNNCLSKSGKAWGIVTVSYPGKKKSKTLDEIKQNIKKLYDFATQNIDKEFLIAYTGKSNYNLNGYSNKQLAECFSAFKIPDNIVFEEEFSTLLSLQGGFEI
jgi:hypothetical protein